MRTVHDLCLDKKIDQTIINSIRYYDKRLPNQYKFECKFCGKDFGLDVVELALHIGKVHEKF